MRARQLLGRARRLVPARVLGAGIRPDPAPGWEPLAQGVGVSSAPQSGPVAAPHLAGAFEAVGSTRAFPAPDFWTDDRDGLLFSFALHGFAELAAYAAGEPTAEGDAFWVLVLESWLDECADPSLPGWHPYPTSGRIVAWCAALSRGGWPERLHHRMTASLWRQARFLARNVEHDIGGNHVLRNAAALAIGGACLGAPRLRAQGLKTLERELTAQLLADGGHEERSPSYHREILDELTDVRGVIRRAGGDAAPWLDTAIHRMESWLAALAGPDGKLPLLNDAWEGPGLDAGDERPVRDLAETGYVALRHDADHVVLDVGPVSPDHLPAHAHADVLSFVMWGAGRPVIVDPGAYAYAGPDRDAFRATAAHNTVEVDGADQCDLWGTFRASGLPRVRRVRTDVGERVTIVVAEHDGYRRLADPVVHRRAFCWLPGDGLVVLDTLSARGPHRVRSSLHLAPGVALDAEGRAGPFRVQALGHLGPAEVERGRYAPFLGRSVEIDVLRQMGDADAGRAFGWALLRGGAAVILTPHGARIERSEGPAVELAL